MYTVPQLTDYSATALDAAVARLALRARTESVAVTARTNTNSSATAGWRARTASLTQINDLWLKAAPKEAKRDVGQLVNELKNKIEAKVDATLERIQGSAAASKLAGECHRHHPARHSPSARR